MNIQGSSMMERRPAARQSGGRKFGIALQIVAFLGVVAILPLIIGKIVGNPSLGIGGTSVIIVVGVALETVQALESQMLMRQYKGFLE